MNPPHLKPTFLSKLQIWTVWSHDKLTQCCTYNVITLKFIYLCLIKFRTKSLGETGNLKWTTLKNVCKLGAGESGNVSTGWGGVRLKNYSGKLMLGHQRLPTWGSRVDGLQYSYDVWGDVTFVWPRVGLLTSVRGFFCSVSVSKVSRCLMTFDSVVRRHTYSPTGRREPNCSFPFWLSSSLGVRRKGHNVTSGLVWSCTSGDYERVEDLLTR